MAFPDDLLEQAVHLARREPGRPRQASLRRAISTAYYALFHLQAQMPPSLLTFGAWPKRLIDFMKIGIPGLRQCHAVVAHRSSPADRSGATGLLESAGHSQSGHSERLSPVAARERSAIARLSPRFPLRVRQCLGEQASDPEPCGPRFQVWHIERRIRFHDSGDVVPLPVGDLSAVPIPL